MLEITTTLTPQNIPLYEPKFSLSSYPISNDSSHKILLYTTIGFREDYIICMDLFFQSVLKYTIIPQFDILIIGDKKMKNTLENLSQKFPTLQIRIMIVENTNDPISSSMHRIKIFSYTHIYHYNFAVYIDIDIITLLNLNTLLSQLPIKYENDKINRQNIDIIYALPESTDINTHNIVFWKTYNYTEEDLQFFEKHKIYIFNSGCLAFPITTSMQKHFENVFEMFVQATQQKKRFFFDQAFLNTYFNKKNLVSYDFITPHNYVIFPNLEKEYKNVILHFCGFPGNSHIKYNIMKNYIQKFNLL